MSTSMQCLFDLACLPVRAYPSPHLTTRVHSHTFSPHKRLGPGDHHRHRSWSRRWSHLSGGSAWQSSWPDGLIIVRVSNGQSDAIQICLSNAEAGANALSFLGVDKPKGLNSLSLPNTLQGSTLCYPRFVFGVTAGFSPSWQSFKHLKQQNKDYGFILVPQTHQRRPQLA